MSRTRRLYLVRHAKAGNRLNWTSDDRERPLTRQGQLQAEALVKLLPGPDITQVVSSGYVRCVQTLQPLARALSVPLATVPELEEGSSSEAITRFLASVPDGAVACTHGDVLFDILERLRRAGAVDEGAVRCAKGSTWVVDLEGERFTRARYLEPPDVSSGRD
ncbi:MAG: SixA phosphatase family protein [Candidatus Dormibacteria bacterium]